VVGGAPSAFISRRLRAAQPRALREHGIDPGSISVSCTLAMGRHHRSIFRLVSGSSITRKISGFSPSGHEKVSTDGTVAMILLWWSAQSKENAYRLYGKINDGQ